jgi:hypothetical protein
MVRRRVKGAACDDVDGEAAGALVEHVLGGGCSGLFVLGGCGEGRGSPPRSATASCAAWAMPVPPHLSSRQTTRAEPQLPPW